MHRIGAIAAHDASPSVRSLRSWSKRAARWVCPLSAASSCWAWRVGRNSMLVWKKLAFGDPEVFEPQPEDLAAA
jgi:hypothetical protein